MTKEAILDTVEFSIKQLELVAAELERMDKAPLEPDKPLLIRDTAGEMAARLLGRCQAMAGHQKVRLDFIISELRRCANGRF